jgi:hypothetical protein
MAGGLLFVSQSLLDSWAAQGRIDLSGDAMSLREGEGKGRRYALEPAVRFLRLVDGESDPNRLVARVKTAAQLREMRAEVLGGSVLVGEVAYETEPGFLAEAAALEAAGTTPQAAPAVPRGATVPDPAPGQPPLPRELEERRREADALARFLLDNLP